MAHKKTVKQYLITVTVFNGESWYSYTGYIKITRKRIL